MHFAFKVVHSSHNIDFPKNNLGGFICAFDGHVYCVFIAETEFDNLVEKYSFSYLVSSGK